MPKTIPGVPESISREDYVRLIESVGFDPNNITSLRFLAAGIEAVAFERNSDGGKCIIGSDPACVCEVGEEPPMEISPECTATHGYAKHTVFIPIR